MTKHRIYLEPFDNVPGGYYLGNVNRANNAIYSRTPDVNQGKEYAQHECAALIENMRGYGYACRAVPSFQITRTY
jgi:hypothetical protein